MKKPRKDINPDELFNEALNQDGHRLTGSALRLLLSGYEALRSFRESPMNENELKSIWGLVAYVAYTQNVKEEMVYAVLNAHFGVNDAKALPSRLYEEVIEYLVDLEMVKVVN